jgi:hypothetical protein
MKSPNQKAHAFLAWLALGDDTAAWKLAGKTRVIRLESDHPERLLKALERARTMGGLVSHPVATGRSTAYIVSF